MARTYALLPSLLVVLLFSSVACGGGGTRTLRVESGTAGDPAERARNERAIRQLQARQEAERATPEGRLAMVRREGPGWLLSRVLLEPEEAEGEVGFRVEAISSTFPWVLGSDLGVGDVVLQVDGMPVSDPDTLVQLWERLASASAVTVEILRDDQRHEIVIALPQRR